MSYKMVHDAINRELAERFGFHNGDRVDYRMIRSPAGKNTKELITIYKATVIGFTRSLVKIRFEDNKSCEKFVKPSQLSII